MATAAEMMDLLRERYGGSDYALLPGVPDGTGGHKSRTADAIAMSLWPSNGLDVYGFEIKVSRSDWLREIQDPLKADAFTKYCDFWFVVAPDGIVKLEEMPGSWGLMTPGKSGGALRVKKGAERNATPSPIDRSFLAGLMRTIHRNLQGEKELKAAYDKGYRECRERTAASNKAQQDSDVILAGYNHKQLTKSVEEFEKASGVKIDLYNGKRIGDLINGVDAARIPSAIGTMKRLASLCENAAEELRKSTGDLAAVIGRDDLGD